MADFWENGANRRMAIFFSLSTVSFIVYSNTLAAGFVYDDSRAIESNYDLRPDAPWSGLLTNDFWGAPLQHSGSHKSYRPLTVLTFRLNYYLGQLDPLGYHLVNVILHCINTCLMFALSRRLLTSTLGRLLCSVLFAVHPIHTEAVAGLVGRAELLCAFIVLSTVVLYASHCATLRRDDTTASLACTVVVASTLAMLAKEQGVTLPVLLGLYRLLVVGGVDEERTALVPLGGVLTRDFWRKKHNRSLRRHLAMLATVSLTLTAARLWLVAFESPVFSAADNPAAQATAWSTRLATFLYLPVFNLRLVLLPDTLSFDWSMDAIPLVESFFDWRFSLSIAVYATLAIGTLKLLREICLNDETAIKAAEQSPRSEKRSRAASPKFDCNANRISPVKDVLLDNNNSSNSTTPSCGLRQCNLSAQTSEKVRKLAQISRTDSATNDTDKPDRTSVSPARSALFALAFMIITFLPASNLLAYVGFVVAERVLYLPSVGYCLLVALGAENLREFMRRSWPAYYARGRVCMMVVSVLALSALAGRTWVRNNDWLTDEALYRSGLEINTAKAYTNLGNVLSKSGRLSEAESAYSKALQHRSNMADTHYNLGTLLQEQGRFGEAVECHRKAIQYRKQLATAYLNLGMALWSLERHEEAEETFSACAQLSDAGLKDPLAHRHARTSCLYNLGRLLTSLHRPPRTVVAVYRRAVALLTPAYAATASVYNMLGEALLAGGDETEAERVYRRALEAKPAHVPAHLTMGHLKLKQKFYAEAEQWFTSAVQLSAASDASPLFHLGQFYEQTNRQHEAVDAFRRALQVDAHHYDATLALATSLRLLGDTLAAERAYYRAVELRPASADARLNLGAILHVTGRLKEAEREYVQALTLDAHNGVAQENLRKVRRQLAAVQQNG